MTGPLTQASENVHHFCLNLIYATACSMTVEAWQLIEKAPKTDSNKNDAAFYLETLFLKPLEENV